MPSFSAMTTVLGADCLDQVGRHTPGRRRPAAVDTVGTDRHDASADGLDLTDSGVLGAVVGRGHADLRLNKCFQSGMIGAWRVLNSTFGIKEGWQGPFRRFEIRVAGRVGLKTDSVRASCTRLRTPVLRKMLLSCALIAFRDTAVERDHLCCRGRRPRQGQPRLHAA